MTYEFACGGCQNHFEVEQPITAEHRADCPKCGIQAQRVYSKVGHYWDNPKPLYHKDGSYEEKY